MIVSNWGSDIYYFGRFEEHKQKIREVMEAADYVQAECERDLRLAREFGFEGEPFAVVPCGGGFDLEEMRMLRQPGRPSARRTIVLKGYQGEFGRALVGLQALSQCADVLDGYRIVITRATSDVEAEAKRLAEATGLEIEIEAGTRKEVLRLHGCSRLFIGLAVSEAANTVVPPEDPDTIAAAIRRALADDELIDRAAELNARMAAERLDEQVVRPQVVRRYTEIMAATSSTICRAVRE